MTVITEKPKSFTALICALQVDESIDFAIFHYDTIRTLISSKQKNRPNLPRNKFPSRVFKTERISVLTPGSNEEVEIVRATRIW